MNVLLLLILFAHSSAAQAEPSLIRIQVLSDPGSLNPAKISDQLAYSIASNTTESLFRVDENGQLQNGLIASYKLSKDKKKYSFRLRKDALWSDGKAVTIEDCIFGLQHGIDPETGASDAELLFPIRGAKSVYKKEAKAETIAVSRNGTELVIELERPDPIFPLVLTMPLTAPLRKDYYEKFLGKWNIDIPVTGKYRVKKYEVGKELFLEPNPQRSHTALHPIQLKIIANEAAALNLFESGHLDIISTIPTTELDRLRKIGRIDSSLGTSTNFLTFNITKKPFDDSLWRKAIAAAVDRDQLSKFLGGFYEPTLSFLPQKIDGYFQSKRQFEKELKMAREQRPKPQITLEYAATAMNNVIMEKLKNDIDQKLGITISLHPHEPKVFLKQLDVDAPAFFFSGMGAPYNDPLNHLNLFTNEKSSNRAKYKNSEYEQLVALVRTLAVGKKRIEATQKAQKILLQQDSVVIPLLERKQLYGISHRMKSFKVNPYNVIAFDKLLKKADGE